MADKATRTAMEELINDELIREEVRNQIGDLRKPIRSRLWPILNSSFFLWFMSSVVLTSGVFAYNILDREMKKSDKRVERIENLRAEVAYRLNTDLLQKIFETKGSKADLPNSFHVRAL